MTSNTLTPGMVIQPTKPWLDSMKQCGCPLPYDGVLVTLDGPFCYVLWNNAEGRIMSMRTDSIQPSKAPGRKQISQGELQKLVSDLADQLQ